jgi:hypothetical protein
MAAPASHRFAAERGLLFVGVSLNHLTSGPSVPVHVGFREPEPSDGVRRRNPMFKVRRSASALHDESFD